MTGKKDDFDELVNDFEEGGKDDAAAEVSDVPEAEIMRSRSEPVVTEELEEYDPRPKKPAPKGKPRKGYTRIILEDNEDIPPTGLFVSINGKPYLIRSGVEVDVPDNILEVLDHAVKDTPIVDPDYNQVVGYRKRHRFPYQRLS